MNNMGKNFSLLEFLKKMSGWATGVITFLTLLVGFVILFRDNQHLVFVLIIFISSFALVIICAYVILKKTSPLIIGGKGLYKYTKIRPYALFVGIAILILNIMFIRSPSGGQIVTTAFNGTMVPPTNSPPTPGRKETPTVEKTPTPRFEDLIKVRSTGPCAPSLYAIPSDFEIDEGIILQKLFQQDVDDKWKLLKYPKFEDAPWKKWDLIEYPPDAIEITNLSPQSSSWTIISNSASIVIDSYEPLDHMNFAGFAIDFIYFPPGGCGGGGQAKIFTLASLMRSKDVFRVKQGDYDYFSLQPGEVEVFKFPVTCGQSGLFRYHVEMETSFMGKSEIIASNSQVLYCPESYSKFSFYYLPIIPNETYELYAVQNYGYYAIKKALSNPVIPLDNVDWFWPSNILNNNNEYQMVLPGYTNIKPWKVCPNTPLSELTYDNFLTETRAAISNPDSSVNLNVHHSPTLNSKILYQLPPNTIVYIEEEPACANDLVWWHVSWMESDKNNIIIARHEGWAVESDGDKQFLIPCLGNSKCNANPNP